MINNNNIKITVLMPVFNGKLFIKAAIESILVQTHNNFEFLIINDGSTDDSDSIIKLYSDKRIKYIKNEDNKGIVATLNEGLMLSSGKYIARMDADDISLPQRLEKQVAFLENHPEYVLCGCRALAINAKDEKLFNLNRPTTFEQIKVFNLFRNAFIHPSVMAHTAIMKKFGYREDYKYAEDYHLFSQLTMNYKVANLGERLLYYRLHEESITSKKNIEMVINEMKTMKFLLSFLFDKLDDKSLRIHLSVLRPQSACFSSIEIHDYLINILQKNKEKQVFSNTILRKQLQKEWYNYLIANAQDSALNSYISSPLFMLKNFNPKQLLKLLFK